MAFDHDTAPKGATKSATGKTVASGQPAETIELAQVAGAIQRGGAAPATRVVPSADGVVRLPAGTSLDNIHAEGRDLVVQLPDGSQIIVTDGAVTVPQLLVGDVALPAQNVIALLVGNEPQPAAGPPASSGGNFAVALGDIGPGVGIGDLLPPTALAFSPPTFEELSVAVDEEPTVIIVTPNNPGAPEVVQTTSDAGLPVRNGNEPAGTQVGTAPTSVSGTIVYTPGDEPSTVTINGLPVVVGAVIPATVNGQVVGTLTITSVAPGAIGYTFTQADNVQHTGGNNDQIVLDLPIVVTDRDGDTATGSLTITIMDDAPIARADFDSVTEDTSTVANGNVITGALIGGSPDANATDGVSDTPGADGATVTGVAVGTPASASGNIGASLAGTYGSLVLSANGNYVYTLNNSAANVQALKPGQTVTDTFTYTLTDGDGDLSSTTLTITINGSNDAPTATGSTIAVSEEGLTGGIADTVGNPTDTTNLKTASGTIVASDGDGDALTYSVSAPAGALTSGGVAITWSAVGGTLVGSAGGVEVIRVAVGSNGAYTVTLSQAIDHVSGNGENVTTLTVPVSVSDGTASASVSLVVNVEDDSPTMARADVSVPTLTVDETVLATDASASFAALFTSAFGADGAGTLTYALSAVAGASGLTDVATGQAVNLVMNGGVVEGRTAGSNALVFTVSVSANGTVTLDQLRAVVHADATNADDARTLSAANLVTLTATIADRDGDTASQAVQIGQNLVFKDDGPSLVASATQPTLTVDDSTLATNASASFASVFTPTFGADGAGTVGNFVLAVKSAGVASGLVDVATGQAVNLVMNAGVVEGRTAGSNALVFTVSVAADGTVTLDQVRAVQHSPEAGPDQSTGLSADDLITLTATVTDKDGDTATSTAQIGSNLVFKDDAPTLSASAEQPTLTVDETTLATNATASFAGVFTPAFGADGAGSVSGFTLNISAPNASTGMTDMATGEAIKLVMNGSVVEGRTVTTNALVFTVATDAAGNVTLDQMRALAHSPNTGPDQSTGLSADNLITLTATVTDKDGDTSTATANIGQNLVFKDDAPTAFLDTGSLTEGGTLNVAAGVGVLANDLGGADGKVAAAVVGVATGSNTASPVAGGLGAPIETSLGFLTLNADGSYTYQSKANSIATNSVDHFVYTMVDRDGDTSTVTLDINIQAGGPVLTDDHETLVNESALDLVQGGADLAPGTVVGTLPASTLETDSSNTLADNVTGGAGTLTYTIVGSTTGLYGVISVNSATGAYTYTLTKPYDTTPDANNGAQTEAGRDVFTYRVTDGNGNFSEAKIYVDIVDDTPVVSLTGASQSLTVDETTLATDVSASYAGLFTVNYGADGANAANALVYSLGVKVAVGDLLSGVVDMATLENVKLVMNAGVVEGRTVTTNQLVFTVSVNSANGVVTLDQVRAIQHTPDTGADQSKSLAAADLITLTATAKDGDGDMAGQSVDIAQTLTFKDDGPSISPSAAADALVVDETTLAINASANFADNFSSSFGADAAGTITYAVNAIAGASGLIDVATGQAVNLVMNAGVVEGRTAGSNLLVFTVSVDSAGTVTLDQVRAVQHPNAANPDDAVTLSAANLVTVTATITDKDGDAAAATINVGQALNFKDDGPSISATAAADALTVDDTTLATNASANFADNFTSSFGADGAGAIGYALSTLGGVSGLIDVATGQTVVLSMNGGVVEGRTSGSNALVFTVSVDGAGVVTLDQMRAIQHSPNTGPDQSTTLSAANLIQLTATITDKDGDSAPATINIAQALTFKDDAPSIGAIAGADALVVDETNLAVNASANYADNFISAFGADAAGAVTYAMNTIGGASGLIDVATGQAVILSMNAGVVEGRTAISNALVFTVSIDSAGTVTLDQLRAVQHPNAANPDDAVTLSAANLITMTATITDKDGDPTSSTLNVGQALSFKDDGPSISVSAAADAMIVDETNLAINASANFADNFTSGFGADGAGTLTYALNAIAGASGLVDVASNQAVNLVMNAGVIEARTAGSNLLVFTVSVDSSGVVTVDQLRAVVHPNAANPDDAVTLAAANLMTLTATVTDKDGDSASATTNIGQAVSFKDDGPSISVSAAADAMIVDETNLAINATANFADNFTSAFGADGAGVVGYALSAVAGASGLVDVASNQAVNLVMNGGVVEGRTAGSNLLVFTISVDASGNVTLDQLRAVVHPNAANPDDAVTLAAANLVTLTATITDKDGDSASAAINVGQAVSFKDDGPSIAVAAAADALVVDDTTLATNATANFADNFTSSFGADGAGAVAYAVNTAGGASGLVDVATGEAVNLVMNGGVVEGRTASTNQLVFTVSVNGSGTVTLDQIRAIQHTPNTGPDQSTTLSAANLITLTATVTDQDGDSAPATINIGQALTFKDDAPTLGAATNITNLTTQDGSGQFVFSVGADKSGTDKLTTYLGTPTLSGSVGSTAVTNVTVTADLAGSSSTLAKYTIAFDYVANPAQPLVTTHETGYVTFDGTNYAIHLDQPIQSYSQISTSATISKESYNTDGGPASQPDIVVSKLAADFFVRFTGANNNLQSNPSPTTWAQGEQFTGTKGWVSISGTENGVSSDTLQNSEVLNMDFYTTSTGNSLTPVATKAQADTVFIKLAQLGAGEDFVVILKLVDPDDNSVTTRAVVVDAADIYGSGEVNPYGITFAAGEDGVVIIESNDYNFGAENYKIVGMQLMTSTNGITSANNVAIDLNRATGTGATGASAMTDEFDAVTNDSDVIKITDIGFVKSVTTTQTLHLDIGVTVTDKDGDATTTTHLFVNPTPPIVLDIDGDGAEFVGTAAGVTFDYFGDGSPEATAWAGSDDGVLAIDLNGNGKVDSAAEISFAAYVEGAKTDLEGLKAFDSNHDGQLSAADADFAKFGVLQGGELKSLAAMGIEAINLSSDGQSYTAAGGEVTVFGTGSYTRADGTTASFADAAFAYKQQQGSSTLANTLVAAALVAAPVEVAEAAAREPLHTDATVSTVAVEEPTASVDVAMPAASTTEAHAAVKTVSEVSEAPASTAHLDTASASAPAQVSEAADAAPSELAQDTSLAVDHASAALVSVDSVPMASAEMIQAAQTAAHPGQPASLAEVLADALSGGDHSLPSIDSLLANLPNAGAAEKGELVAQILNEPVHYTDSAPISAYEMAQVTPDAVTHLTNG